MIRKLNFLTALKIILLTICIEDQAVAKLRMIYNGHDALFVARCEAKCWKLGNRGVCVKECLSKVAKKPGFCPQNTTLSPFAAACIQSCHYDSQCSGLAKCCQHNCGVTCQQPERLLSAVDVPDITKDLNVTEGRQKRSVLIQWASNYNQNSLSPIVYLIEERHLAGKHFIESRMSQWTPFSRSVKKSIVLKKVVKPGCWYQFRVAAVNENGTRGYSESSLPFSMSVSPREPRAPQNMTLGPLFWTKNGNLNVMLKWQAPSSDLPIEKYKVFWSTRLHGIKALESVLVRQQVVSKDKTCFFLQNLTEDSLYFLQVQALSRFGNKRLKSEKSALILNTTNFKNVSDNFSLPHQLNPTPKERIEDLRLQKLFWSKGNLRARIMWRSQKGTLRYTVTWWKSGLCNQNSENSFGHSKLSATTTISQFELYDITFNCRYKVDVREITSEGTKSHHPDTSISFATPSCEKFKATHKKIKCIDDFV